MKKRFQQLVKKFISKAYPDYQDTGLIEQEQSNIEEFDAIFGELFRIYKYKERYDLHRALKEADNQFKMIMDKIFQQQLKPRVSAIVKDLKESSEKKNMDVYSDDIFATARNKEKKFRKKSFLFSLLGNLVSLIDIIISVGLIVLISMISHRGNTFINSVVLGIVFLVIIALLKVTLDRFWVIPKVHDFGRKLYIRNIKKFKEDLAKFEAISLVIICSISKDDHPMTTIDLMKRGVRYMKEE